MSKRNRKLNLRLCFLFARASYYSDNRLPLFGEFIITVDDSNLIEWLGKGIVPIYALQGARCCSSSPFVGGLSSLLLPSRRSAWHRGFFRFEERPSGAERSNWVNNSIVRISPWLCAPHCKATARYGIQTRARDAKNQQQEKWTGTTWLDMSRYVQSNKIFPAWRGRVTYYGSFLVVFILKYPPNFQHNNKTRRGQLFWNT